MIAVLNRRIHINTLVMGLDSSFSIYIGGLRDVEITCGLSNKKRNMYSEDYGRSKVSVLMPYLMRNIDLKK